MQERLIGGGVAAAIFLPLLFVGGLPFQLLVGAMAMVAVSEMLRMKHLEIFSIEGVLSMLAAFILVVPIDHYFNSLPTDASVTGFAIISFLILAGTVLNSDHYSFDDAVYPITSAFYVGFGFQNLIAARLDSWEKVLFALFIVWATDIGAYLFGRRFGQNKLLPKVSPNKTIEGSVGGILSAIIVALLFGLINHNVYAPHSFFWLLICTVLFSIFGQFGDLVESAIKRHFGVKDSGNLIPGHGGILDRCDSWIFVFPIMHLLGLF